MSTRALKRIAAAAAVYGCLHYVAPASACSPGCEPRVSLPSVAWLPGNMVYFRIVGAEAGPLRLRTAAGDIVPAQVRTLGGERVFAADASIPSETELVLEYTTNCDALDGPALHSFAFTADLDASVELRPSQLTVAERGVMNPGDPSNEAGFVRLRHYGPDAAGTIAGLLHSTATVDGQRLSMVGDMLELRAQCSRDVADGVVLDPCGNTYAVSSGVHTVEVQTLVVGYAAQPDPVRFEVDVRCPSDELPACEATSNLDQDLVLDASDAGRPSTASGTSGCALGAASASGGGIAFGALALVVAAVSRRRAPRG